MIRTFAAIKVDPSKELIDLLDRCREHFIPSQVKWVELHNLHITLRFFGNTEIETIPTIIEKLSVVAQNQAPFSIEIAGIGAFGTSASPKIIYAGILESTPFQQLSIDIERLARQVGFEPQCNDKTPHLTLGRPKGNGNEVPTNELITLFNGRSFGKFYAENIYLYQSISTGTGPLYQPIEIVPLKLLDSSPSENGN